MDVIDHAAELEEMQRQRALQACFARRDKVSSREDCRDCGEEIGIERRRAVPGAQRCLSCQEDAERRGSHR